MKSVRAIFSLIFGLTVQGAGPIPYAPAPDDTYFPEQWYLEGLNENTERIAIDINARSAWSLSRGAGVTIAIVDVGVELIHPDLTNQAVPSLHWNFETETPAGHPQSDLFIHGTPVAGLAVAQGNNGRGVIGAAPEARFASWVIYNTNSGSGTFVNGEKLARMFQFHANEVQIQNHSWVKPGIRLVYMTAAENLAISNAVHHGRGGLGVVMIRASGNTRADGRNANEDAYTADPRVITVSAIRGDGRVASYSTPGTPILVAAPGGDVGGTLMTTDRVGDQGYNRISFTNDLADYVFSGFGFSGTSASAPLVSGITALMLSANTNLTARDVQHILVQSAFQPDVNDPANQVTPAGLRVSDNTGFGTVNAGTAVEIAKRWTTVPAAMRVTNTVARTNAIPDAGLRLLISGSSEVPPDLQSIIGLPGLGLHPDDPTRTLPLVYVGQANSALMTNLTGKGALIQRGGGSFDLKIENAAKAGAEFAVIFNNTGTNSLEIMGGTDFVTIPAVFITQRDGEALAALATNSVVQAQIALEAVDYEFTITEPLITEHVRVHLDVFHEARGDMRVTLVSPMGTRSVLQRLGPDTTGFDGVWTYMSTHHFYESPIGTWRLEVSDQANEAVGAVRSATLEISGIPITDSDRDGLDDDWERAELGNLASGLADDPEADGYSNAREQIQGLDPRANDSTLEVDLSAWNESFIRLNWPARSGVVYEVLGATDLRNKFEVIATVPGGFPRAAWFGRPDRNYHFFTVREQAP